MPFTPITERNLRYFRPLLPEGFHLFAQGCSAIGHVGEGGVADGAIAYAVDPAGDLVEILSIFVAPQHRRGRIGTGLLDQMMGHVITFPDVELCFMTVSNAGEENESLCRFFEFQRFRKTRSVSRAFSIQLGDIARCKAFAKCYDRASNILSLSQVSSIDRRIYYQQSSSAAPLRGNLNREELDESVSCVYWKDGQIRTLLLVSRQKDCLLLETVHSRMNEPQVLLGLFRTAFSEACKRYPPDMKVVMFTQSQNTQRLINRLFEGRETENSDFSTYTFRFF